MKPKPKKTPTPKRKPAAIVVGRNGYGDIIAMRGRIAVSAGEYGCLQSTVFDDCVIWEEEDLSAIGLNLDYLKPGEYIRFVRDGGVRKARRVKT